MSALKIGLGLGGAFLLYEWYTGGLNSLLGTNSTVAVANVPSTTSTVSTASMSDQLNAKAGGATTLNWFGWNYYYAQITGHTLSNVPGVTDTTSLITADQYLATLSAAGMSGFRKGSGIGMIINLTKMFQGVPLASGFGEQEFSGLGVIVDNPQNSAGYIDEGPFNEAAGVNGSNDGSVTDFLLASNGQG